MTYRPNRPPTHEEWKNSYTLFYRFPVDEDRTYIGTIACADCLLTIPVALFWKIPKTSGFEREYYESITGFTPAKIQECLEELEKMREYFSETDGKLGEVLTAQDFLFAELAKHAV